MTATESTPRPQGAFLVGPDLYGSYCLTLKVALGGVLIAASAVWVTGLVNGAPATALAAALEVVWTGTFVTIGAVTALFAGLERRDAILARLVQRLSRKGLLDCPTR